MKDFFFKNLNSGKFKAKHTKVEVFEKSEYNFKRLSDHYRTKKFILNGMRHKVLDGKNANADTIKTEIFATESIFGSGKKRLFFPQLN